MTKANETPEAETTPVESAKAKVPEFMRAWYSEMRIEMILESDTDSMLEDVRSAVDAMTFIRVEFDKLAKKQGNQTIRKERTDKGTAKESVELTPEQRREAAKAKVLAEIG